MIRLYIGIILIMLAGIGMIWFIWDARHATPQRMMSNYAELMAQDLFEQCWNGRPESVLYAWYRARQHMLIYFNGEEDLRNDMLRFIENRIRNIQELEARRTTHIDTTGRLIQITEIG